MSIEIVELASLNKKLKAMHNPEDTAINELAIEQIKANEHFTRAFASDIEEVKNDKTFESEIIKITNTKNKNSLQIDKDTHITLTDKGLEYFKIVINANKIKETLKNENINMSESLSLGACLYAMNTPFSDTPYNEFKDDFIKNNIETRYNAITTKLLDNIEEQIEKNNFEEAYKASLVLQTATNTEFFNTKDSLVATEIMNFTFAQKGSKNEDKNMQESTVQFLNRSILKLRESLNEENTNSRTLQIKAKV